MFREGTLTTAVSRPTVFGVYRVIEELGAGPFGSVYRAQAAAEAQPVVVRAFSRISDPAQGVVLLEALRRICDAPLEHPSIARPLACGIEGNLPYIVYAYLEGRSLRDTLSRGQSRWLMDLLRSVIQAASAIDFAATAGVHHGALDHCDLIVGEETTGVTGFGVIEALLAAGITVPGPVPFASPQRKAGDAPAQADDVYALAALTYDLVYGRPFERDETVPDVDGFDSARLAAVFRDALADQAAARPASALQFAAALQDAVAGPPAEEHVIIPDASAATAAETPHATDGWGDLSLHAAAATAPAPPPAPEVDVHHVPRPVYAGAAVAADVPPSGTRWGLVAAALAIGIVLGFAGGLTTGSLIGDSRLGAAPAPAQTQASAGGSQATEEAVEQTAGSSDEITSGSGEVVTSEPLATPEPPAASQPSAAPQPPAASQPPASITEPSTAIARSTEPMQPPAEPRPSGRPVPASAVQSGWGTLQIESLPSGAEVILNGRTVGSTPLVLSDVAAGNYRVQLALPGHRPWVTAVTVDGGSRARVGASLEQQ